MFKIYIVLYCSALLNIKNYMCSILHEKSDVELIYLPTLLPFEGSNVETSIQEEPIQLNLTAFGTSIPLKLIQNKNLISPTFKVLVHDENNEVNYNPDLSTNCYYLHQDTTLRAALSLCNPRTVHGYIFQDDSIIEINPLDLQDESHESFFQALENEVNQNTNENLVPHIVKKSTSFSYPLFKDDTYHIAENLFSNENNEIREFDYKYINKRVNSRINIEVAVFFDEAAYKIFAPYLKYDENRLTNMLLAYMNGVQALYHHESLGKSAEITIVRLEIMKKQPSKLPHYNGERSKLLDSFCEYQTKKNPGNDKDPEHWDMALYVSGLDFFAYENGKKSGVTMGLAPVGGVCLEKFNCVIAELGTTNVFGKPYPSAGFTSVYILAHEIGHNLGMHHDSSGNRCPKEGYIMSPSRGTSGETIWSSCSAEIMNKLSHATCLMDKPGKVPSNLNHNKFSDTPGQSFGAKRQCEILLRDKDAVVSPNQYLSEICYNLQCKTPRRSGYYHAGPALEGTECGKGKWCRGGSCIKMIKKKPVTVSPGGWSQWKFDSCSSGCLKDSKGYQHKQRECNNPKPVNTDEGCEGTSYETVLCNDNKVCNRRYTPVEYASIKCKEFSELLSELDPKGAGLQAPHETARPWMGCAIFCRRADSGSYYTPRVELNDLHVSPYFPDGTWCHNDGSSDYYCLHHHCLPENFQFTKTSLFHGIGEDIPIPQNARPSQIIPPELFNYLSLDPNGRPLQTKLKPNQIKPPTDEDWETKDYIEIPSHLRSEFLADETGEIVF